MNAPGGRRAAVGHLLASAGGAALFALATLTTALPAGLRRPMADLLLAAAALGTGQLILRSAGRGDAATRLAWRCAGWASVAWGCGQLWLGLEHLAIGNVVRPGPSDVGYLVGVVFAIRAALALPTVAGNRTGRGRALLDGAIVAGCALLLAWLFVLAAPGGSPIP